MFFVGSFFTRPQLIASNTLSHIICVIPPLEISLGPLDLFFLSPNDGVTILENPIRFASLILLSSEVTGLTSPNKPTSPTNAVSARIGIPTRLLTAATATARSDPPPLLVPFESCIPPTTLR